MCTELSIGFLIILLSTTIYTPPHALHVTTNLPLEHLTHALERRLVLSLLCSFLNTSLTPSKATAGIGGQIPYNHLVSKTADDRRTLVRASFTLLLVALDYRKEDPTQMGEGKDENAFRYFISKLVSGTSCESKNQSGNSWYRSIEKRTSRSSLEGYWAYLRNIPLSVRTTCQEVRSPYHIYSKTVSSEYEGPS